MKVLRAAGLEVKESNSLIALGYDLTPDQHVDVVIISEDDQKDSELAADFAHRHSLAPVILFRRDTADLDESKFDRVYQSFISPSIWLTEMALLIQKGRFLQNESARLQQESQAVLEKSRRERERSRRERERSNDMNSFWRLRD